MADLTRRPSLPPERVSMQKAQQQILSAYSEVAELLQLPEREAKPLPGAPPPPPPRRASTPSPTVSPGGRRLGVGLLLGAGGLAALLTWPREPSASDRAPASLHGTWTSQHPDFVGRALAIAERRVELHGENFSSGGEVRHVIVVDSGGTERITLEYDGRDEGRQRLELLRRRGTPDAMELRRPAGVVWNRAR